MSGAGELGEARPGAADEWVVRRRIDADHPAFSGHFPGRPLLPGVALVALVMEALQATPSLAARVGAAPRLSVTKFVAPVLPETTLELRVRAGVAEIAFTVAAVDAAAGARQVVATGQFATIDRADPGRGEGAS